MRAAKVRSSPGRDALSLLAGKVGPQVVGVVGSGPTTRLDPTLSTTTCPFKSFFLVLWLVFKSFIGTLQPFYHAGFRGVMTTDSHLHDYRFHVSCLQIPVLMTTDSMLRATDSMRYPQAGANAG